MALSYEQQVAIGNIFNMAIKQVIGGMDVTEEHPEVISDIARSILVMIDQSGFKIVPK
jgi:hypothetical protein